MTCCMTKRIQFNISHTWIQETLHFFKKLFKCKLLQLYSHLKRQISVFFTLTTLTGSIDDLKTLFKGRTIKILQARPLCHA